MAQRDQPLWIKFLFSAVLLLLFILISEVVLRLVDPDLYQKNQFFPTNRDIDFVEVYKQDPQLFWRFRPDQNITSAQFSYIDYRINKKGLRGPEIELEKKGLRLLALGNSCTFGWGVKQNAIWTSLLEQTIKKLPEYQNFEVINAGVPGYSSHQGNIYFENELLKYKPDVVLIMFGWNDERPAGKDISDHEHHPPPEVVFDLQNLISKLKLYQFMRKFILSTTEKQEMPRLDQLYSKKRVPLPNFLENLRHICHVARQNNIVPVLLIPPIASVENYFPGQTSYFHQLHKKYQDEIAKAGRYENVPVIDLQPPFDRYNDLFSNAADDPTHFNAKGQIIAVEAILPVIQPILDSLKTAGSVQARR